MKRLYLYIFVFLFSKILFFQNLLFSMEMEDVAPASSGAEVPGEEDYEYDQDLAPMDASPALQGAPPPPPPMGTPMSQGAPLPPPAMGTPMPAGVVPPPAMVAPVVSFKQHKWPDTIEVSEQEDKSLVRTGWKKDFKKFLQEAKTINQEIRNMIDQMRQQRESFETRFTDIDNKLDVFFQQISISIGKGEVLVLGKKGKN